MEINFFFINISVAEFALKFNSFQKIWREKQKGTVFTTVHFFAVRIVILNFCLVGRAACDDDIWSISFAVSVFLYKLTDRRFRNNDFWFEKAVLSRVSGGGLPAAKCADCG